MRRLALLLIFLIAADHVGQASDQAHALNKVKQSLSPMALLQTMKDTTKEPGLLADAFPNPFDKANGMFPSPDKAFDQMFPTPHVSFIDGMFPNPIGDLDHPDTQKSLIVVGVLLLSFILSTIVSYVMSRKKMKAYRDRAGKRGDESESDSEGGNENEDESGKGPKKEGSDEDPFDQMMEGSDEVESTPNKETDSHTTTATTALSTDGKTTANKGSDGKTATNKGSDSEHESEGDLDPSHPSNKGGVKPSAPTEPEVGSATEAGSGSEKEKTNKEKTEPSNEGNETETTTDTEHKSVLGRKRGKVSHTPMGSIGPTAHQSPFLGAGRVVGR